MDDILKLAKDYSKKRHLDLLPHGNNNILENLEFIYDENWENQGVPYPYEILTYLFDSYYVCLLYTSMRMRASAAHLWNTEKGCSS